MKLSDDMVVTAIPSMTGRAYSMSLGSELVHMKSMREAEVLEVVD
jgi:hypothetical protein